MRMLLGALTLIVMSAPAAFSAADDCKMLTVIESHLSAGKEPDGATCATYLTVQARQGISCQWQFPLRDADASALADSIWDQIQRCKPGQPLETDQPVNHPDSYALKAWVSESEIYSVSVKDKGGQNRTLTFLRIEPVPN